MSPPLFDRCNLAEVPLAETRAHEGDGRIQFVRIASQMQLAGSCHFIDLAVLPPGTSIGEHTHECHEEEFYLVLAGRGTMRRDGEAFPVRTGDLIRNAPGGTHQLVNDGEEDLRVFVFEVEAA